MIVLNTAHIHPSMSGKIENARVNSPLIFFCRMYVNQREREHDNIDFFVSEDPAAILVLSQYGLLNFF